MTETHLSQLVAAIVAVGTPWCVVRIAWLVASRHAAAVQRPLPEIPSIRLLRHITLAVLPVVVALAFWLQPPSLVMSAAGLAAFAALSIPALRALSDIHEASRPAREVDAPVRAAALRPRRLGQYLDWKVRLLPLVATLTGAVLFAWRVASPQPHRRLFVPIVFACSAVIFFLLYEGWLREEVTAGRADDGIEDEQRRARQLHLIFGVELALVTGCLGVAHGLLNLDWAANDTLVTALTLGGAALGIGGCALALSSPLGRRSYAPAKQRP